MRSPNLRDPKNPVEGAGQMSKSTATVLGLFLLMTLGVRGSIAAQEASLFMAPAMMAPQPTTTSFLPEPATTYEPVEQTVPDPCSCCGCGPASCDAPLSAETCGCASCYSPCHPSWLNSSFDMPPHYAYFPPMHGYYYFRPYSPQDWAKQRGAVEKWGGNPLNPYANQIFQAVYAEYKAERSDVAGTVPKLSPDK